VGCPAGWFTSPVQVQGHCYAGIWLSCLESYHIWASLKVDVFCAPRWFWHPPNATQLSSMEIQSNPRCPLCCSRNPTTLHILNSCVSAFNQGRYTWRHDSVLSCIVSWLTPTLGEDKCMYADSPGHRASDSPPATIPTDILSTSCHPDLFLCVGSTVKLTVCSNTVEGFSNAWSRKQCNQLKWWVTLNLGALCFIQHHWNRFSWTLYQPNTQSSM